MCVVLDSTPGQRSVEVMISMLTEKYVHAFAVRPSTDVWIQELEKACAQDLLCLQPQRNQVVLAACAKTGRSPSSAGKAPRSQQSQPAACSNMHSRQGCYQGGGIALQLGITQLMAQVGVHASAADFLWISAVWSVR